MENLQTPYSKLQCLTVIFTVKMLVYQASLQFYSKNEHTLCYTREYTFLQKKLKAKKYSSPACGVYMPKYCKDCKRP